MNAFDTYIQASPIDILKDFNKQKAIDAGIPQERVGLWEKTFNTYFGETTSPKKQRQAREAAAASGLSLDQLCMIERELKAIKDTRSRNKLRLILLALRGTYKQLMALVKARIAKPKRVPKDGVRFSKSTHRKRTMTVTADEDFLADVEHALTHELDDGPAMAQMLARLKALLLSDASLPHPTSIRRPIVLIPVDDHKKLIKGEGDEITFGLTDGTTTTGAELIAQGYGDQLDLELALIHPNHGPVNTYRAKRHANSKQRDLARIANPVCPVPGCRHSADNCQIHHITPWSQGGETNADNLSVLCRYHNQTNHDDPTKNNTKRKAGRIHMHNGHRMWVSPYGTPAPNPYHPYSANRLLFGQPA